MTKPTSIINNPAYIGIPSSQEELRYEKRSRIERIMDDAIENNSMIANEETILNYLTEILNKKDEFDSLDRNERLFAIMLATAPKGHNNIIQFDDVRNKINLLCFDKAARINYRRKILEYLTLTGNSSVTWEFFKIPYDYRENTSKEVQEQVKAVENSGLLGKLDEFHTFLKRIGLCPTENERNAFSILFLSNTVGLLNILDVFSNDMRCDHEKVFNAISTKIKELTPSEKTVESKKDAVKDKKKLEPILGRLSLSVPAWLTKSEYDGIKSETLKTELLISMLKNNQRFYTRTTDRLKGEALRPELEKLFKESRFSYSRLTEEQKCILAARRNSKDIRDMLEMLSSSDFFDDSFPIYDILLISKPTIIFEINKLLKNKKVSVFFVKSNISIFASEIDESLLEYTTVKEAKYDLFIDNTYKLINSKVNTLALSNSLYSSTLLSERENIERIVEIINAYGLNYMNARYFGFFNNLHLITKLDEFIELGLGEFIRNNPDYICEKADIFLKRIRICRFLRIPLIRNDDIFRVLNSPQFEVNGNLISNDDLDLFILPNACPRFEDVEAFGVIERAPIAVVQDKEVLELQSYQKGKLTYKIGEIIISKPKVLRNLSIIEQSEECRSLSREQKIFNAMIHGSNLSDDELTDLSRQLKEDIKKLQME